MKYNRIHFQRILHLQGIATSSLAICSLVLCLALPSGVSAQRLAEDKANITISPNPPPSKPCIDPSLPVGPKKNICARGFTLVAVNGQQRCVEACQAGELLVDVDCSRSASPTCAKCSRTCRTCSYQEISFANVSIGNHNTNKRLADASVFTTPKGSLSCLGNRLETARKGVRGDDYRDDVIFKNILESFAGIKADLRTIPDPKYSKSNFCNAPAAEDATFSTPHKFISCSYQCPPGGKKSPEKDCFGVINPNNEQQIVPSCAGRRVPCQEVSNSCRHYEGVCTNGTFIVDDKCNPVSRESLQSLSGNACISDIKATVQFQASSPISLLWDGSPELGTTSSLVHFPLDMAASNTWYAWYASDRTPLLVYDPSHSGDITTAQQLFGNWTFGGKRSAHQSSSEAGALAKPWRDGYEALSSLDSDGDSLIRGAELKPLGLWFDSNRDGMSQSGEVRPILSTGVTRLYLGPSVTDPISRNITVKIGFERIDNGELVTGASVDWYSQGGQTLTQLISKQELSSRLSTTNSPGQPEDPASPGITIAHGRIAKDSPINGHWVWRGDQDKDEGAQGVLALSEVEELGIQGLSLANAPIQSQTTPVRGVVNFTMLNGTVLKRSTKQISLQFTSIDLISSPQGAKPSVETEATIDLTRGVMRGVTTQRFKDTEPLKTVTYRWTARREP